MTSDFLPLVDWGLLMPYMSQQNALVVRLCLLTGLRVGDAVALPAAAVYGDVLRFTASKTGKQGAAKLPADFAAELRESSGGTPWVFPSRRSKSGHRTRQAVWHDVKQAADAAGVSGNISPHSARKTFAVETMHSAGLGAAKKALQHDSASTTMIYALSDLTRRQPSLTEQDAFAEKVARRVVELLAAALQEYLKG